MVRCRRGERLCPADPDVVGQTCEPRGVRGGILPTLGADLQVPRPELLLEWVSQWVRSSFPGNECGTRSATPSRSRTPASPVFPDVTVPIPDVPVPTRAALEGLS